MMDGGTRLEERQVLSSKLKLKSLLQLVVFIIVLSFPPGISPAAILEKRSEVTEAPADSVENSVLNDGHVEGVCFPRPSS